jgi:histidinol dehydrogenase
MAKKVYVVVTTDNDGERDLFADVVLITEDEKKAQEVEQALKDYIISGKTDGLIKHNITPENLSTPIGGWAYFTRELDGSF